MNENPGLKQKRGYFKKRVCRFCAEPNLHVDYKDIKILRYFVTERGKIIPRRISGNCALHQRKITQEIKRARHIALLSYTSTTAL